MDMPYWLMNMDGKIEIYPDIRSSESEAFVSKSWQGSLNFD